MKKRIERAAEYILAAFLLSMGITHSVGKLKVQDDGIQKTYILCGRISNERADTMDPDAVFEELKNFVRLHNTIPRKIQFHADCVMVCKCRCGCGGFLFACISR